MRGLYMVVMLAGLSLTACGEGSGGEASGGESAAVRTVEHAMGETEVVEDPERVVVLDTGEMDSAVSLGVTPVGAVEAVEGLGFPSYLEDETRSIENVEDVGTIESPNLEAIAVLDPDLILSSKLRHEQIYDQLSQIAPTVFTETTGVTWRENFEKHAEALGREDEAEEVIADYERDMDEFRRVIGEDPPSVSVVRFMTGETRIYQRESFIGTVPEDAGLPRPESQDVADFAILNASREAIPEMGGDVIFHTIYGPEDDTPRRDITSDPVWRQLEAVREGRVHEVSDDLWMLGIGYTAAEGVTEDLDEYLVEAGPR